MKYFLDTEFIESGPGKPIHLISIGIVAEDGRELYAVNEDCPLTEANEWVKANVLPHIFRESTGRETIPLWAIARKVQDFVGTEKPQFWGYYADYDWVVFCQMFGTMVQLPKGWPMYCNDLKQWCKQVGDPTLPAQSTKEHNALNDARWNKLAWEFLSSRGEHV